MCIIIPECLNNSNEMRGETEKCFFFFLLLLFPWRNKWVFFSQDFFLSSKGRRRRSTDIPFRNNRENRREKKELRHSYKKGGPYLLNFSQHTILRPPRLRGEKREIEHQSFFPIFQISKDLGTIFRGKFVWKKSLALAKCPGESERWALV